MAPMRRVEVILEDGNFEIREKADYMPPDIPPYILLLESTGFSYQGWLDPAMELEGKLKDHGFDHAQAAQVCRALVAEQDTRLTFEIPG